MVKKKEQRKRSDIIKHKFDENNIELKKCSHCNEWMSLDNFYRNHITSDGLYASCKKCDSQMKKDRENKPKKERVKTEHVTIDGKIHKKCNICKDIKPLDKFYRNKTLSDGRSRMCAECEKSKRNREQQSEYNKTYKQESENKIRRQINEKSRREEEPSYKLENSLRSRQRHAIMKGKKLAKNKDLWGATIDFVRSHLEDQFYSGMTWDNYGIIWEIDHIIPCSAFDMNNLEEQQICFNWNNLQPLLCHENNKKKDKIYRDLFDMHAWMLTQTIIERITPLIIQEDFLPVNLNIT